MEGAARDRHCDRVPDCNGVLDGFPGRPRWVSRQQLIVTLISREVARCARVCPVNVRFSS
jgi:hypothetical protein